MTAKTIPWRYMLPKFAGSTAQRLALSAAGVILSGQWVYDAQLEQWAYWDGSTWVIPGEGGSVAWADVTGKPSTFPPDLPLTPAWVDITGVPATFPPDAHHASHEAGGSDLVSVDHGVSLANNSSPISSGSLQAVSWANETWDTDGYHDNGTPTRVTIPTGLGGVYLIGANLGFEDGADYVGLQLLPNVGDAYAIGQKAESSPLSITWGSTALEILGLFRLSAGQYVECKAQQNSGVNKALYNGRYWAHKIG